jgi:hypothetical protein
MPSFTNERKSNLTFLNKKKKKKKGGKNKKFTCLACVSNSSGTEILVRLIQEPKDPNQHMAVTPTHEVISKCTFFLDSSI